MFDLTGKTALVTGATGGIGGAIAKALHEQGAHVVLSGTRESALQELAARLLHQATQAPAKPQSFLMRFAQTFGLASNQ